MTWVKPDTHYKMTCQVFSSSPAGSKRKIFKHHHYKWYAMTYRSHVASHFVVVIGGELKNIQKIKKTIYVQVCSGRGAWFHIQYGNQCFEPANPRHGPVIASPNPGWRGVLVLNFELNDTKCKAGVYRGLSRKGLRLLHPLPNSAHQAQFNPATLARTGEEHDIARPCEMKNVVKLQSKVPFKMKRLDWILHTVYSWHVKKDIASRCKWREVATK